MMYGSLAGGAPQGLLGVAEGGPEIAAIEVHEGELLGGRTVGGQRGEGLPIELRRLGMLAGGTGLLGAAGQRARGIAGTVARTGRWRRRFLVDDDDRLGLHGRRLHRRRDGDLGHREHWLQSGRRRPNRGRHRRHHSRPGQRGRAQLPPRRRLPQGGAQLLPERERLGGRALSAKRVLDDERALLDPLQTRGERLQGVRAADLAGGARLGSIHHHL